MLQLRCSCFQMQMVSRKFRKYVKFGVICTTVSALCLLLIASSEQKCSKDGCGKEGIFIHKFPVRETRPSSEVKRILRWTGFFRDQSWEGIDDSFFNTCKVGNCCEQCMFSITYARTQTHARTHLLTHTHTHTHTTTHTRTHTHIALSAYIMMSRLC